ncbi:T9SS type A sorting domain-containing protein [Hymenobacter ginkgonis]|uniref:T9SS type A sorting domain-containing protein n=1 Tax=Hymenobacter ginkgonis TaxID=2682976 RepID=UPI0018DC2388|nr:T9SS type A sorting domain-containing protein [Hymenobacter ginkgonis]
MPTGIASDLYQVWVLDAGQRSASVYVNQAHGLHFDSPEITPGGNIRLFGRNLQLTGTTPQVRFVAQNGSSGGGTAQVQPYDAYSMLITAPTSLVPGQVYNVYVSNGRGGTAGETLVGQSLTAITAGTDYFQLGVAWGAKFDFYKNVYNVRTDARLSKKAVGDGVTNDLAAIQAAVDKASADGGGVVFIPAGTYKLALNAGGGLYMRNRVVVQGAGKNLTILRFGYGSEAAGWSPDGHWGLLWESPKQAGLADLALLNVDNTGSFYNNMAGNGTELFMQRIRFDMNLGSWLSWNNSDKIVISNSEFTQGVDAKAGYRGPLQINGTKNFVVAHNSFTYAVDGLNLNTTNRGVFEDNKVYRDGSARWPEALNLVNHVLIMNFAEDVAVLNNLFKVINGPAQNINDGETIIAEGGGGYGARIDEDAGTATATTPTTLQDNSKNWPAMIQHPVVAIVRGPGMGQWRRIASRTSTTLTVDQPWTVTPQAGSRYAIFNWGARSWIIQGNTLEGNRRGITFYQNATADIAIVNNTLTNSGSIDLTPWQMDNSPAGVPQEFLPVYDTQITGNNVADIDGSNGVFIGVHTIQYLQPRSFGTSVIGVEVRRNTLTAHQPNVPAVVDANFPEGYINDLHFQPGSSNYIDEQTPAILGTIFQDNTAINCDNAVHLNSGAYNTLVCNTKLVNSPNLIEDIKFNAITHGSVSTASCPTSAPTASALPPVADPKTNPVVPHNTSGTRLMPLTGSDPNPNGWVVGFNLRTLPPTTQGVIYLNGSPAKTQDWVPTSQANALTFQPANNYTGQVVFTYTATNDQSLISSAVPFTVPVANPLPVALTQFDAKMQGLDALLTWQTASEVNNDFFEIERSTDASTFATVGRVTAKGTASSYSFTDTGIGSQLQGIVYYRLRQVDLDGTTTYSPTQAVTLTKVATTVQAYPNPTTSELTVRLPSAGAKLIIYTAAGQQIMETSTITAEQTIDVRKLPAGVYLLRIKPTQGPDNQVSFVKEAS